MHEHPVTVGYTPFSLLIRIESILCDVSEVRLKVN